MQPEKAISLITSAIPPAGAEPVHWADIGAGTGLFCQALDRLLPAGSSIYAFDKSPHALWYLRLERCELRVTDGDFEREMNRDNLEWPLLDGMVMANALHYSSRPQDVLARLRKLLKPDGRLVLVEYDLDRPLSPWVPYPVSVNALKQITEPAGWSAAEIRERMTSAYGHSELYVAVLFPQPG